MPNREVQTVAEGYSYTEGPRWHNGEFWFVDFYLHTVNKIDAAGSASVVCTVDEQPSGLGWLPDGRLIVVSMHDRRVLRLEHDGTLGPRRDFADFGFPADDVRDLGERLAGASIAPDGLALDAEGAVWVADTLNERAIRVAEGGAILEEFKVDSNNVIAMTLGGEDGKSLFVCVSPDYDAEKRKAARESGVVVTRVNVRGAGIRELRN